MTWVEYQRQFGPPAKSHSSDKGPCILGMGNCPCALYNTVSLALKIKKLKKHNRRSQIDTLRAKTKTETFPKVCITAAL